MGEGVELFSGAFRRHLVLSRGPWLGAGSRVNRQLGSRWGETGGEGALARGSLGLLRGVRGDR